MTKPKANSNGIFEVIDGDYVMDIHIPPQTDTADFLWILANLVGIRASLSVVRGDRVEVNLLHSLCEVMRAFHVSIEPPGKRSDRKISMAGEQHHRISPNTDNAQFVRIVADLIRVRATANVDKDDFFVANRIRCLADIVAASASAI